MAKKCESCGLIETIYEGSNCLICGGKLIDYNATYEEIENQWRNTNFKKEQSKEYVPKCPICQSPNIRKISSAKRVAHGYAFGLFSNTARSQWECLNCGNKF